MRTVNPLPVLLLSLLPYVLLPFFPSDAHARCCPIGGCTGMCTCNCKTKSLLAQVGEIRQGLFELKVKPVGPIEVRASSDIIDQLKKGAEGGFTLQLSGDLRLGIESMPELHCTAFTPLKEIDKAEIKEMKEQTKRFADLYQLIEAYKGDKK